MAQAAKPPTLLPRSRLGPYEIVSLLGAGGMGEVYRARDPRLDREVAIKVLPAGLASDAERVRRFEHEARAVAALNHPNVLAIFDVGSQEGSPYIVSELLEGETLRDRLKSGGLTVRKAVETAVQIAQGLAAAHEKGIIHRDLKPGNVFLATDGQIKILDFGIAKLTRPDPRPQETATTPEPSTRTGATVGTVGYMSPEQVRGLPADHRTDIFSFGCVLYEMLSGKRAFRGDTPADTMAAVLHDDSPLSGTIKNIPPALDSIVALCLEKRPEDRFQSAHDLTLALQAASAAPGTSPILYGPARLRRAAGLALGGVVLLAAAGVLVLAFKRAGPAARPAQPPRIVVLPFENLGAPEDAYFAAGMADEITSRLANVRGLEVISHTSTAAYARLGKTVRQIGSELGVDYVLEGSVRWERGPGSKSRVRISPQLIRVADDTSVWADRYDRVIADVFAIQSEVAKSAVKAMDVAVLPSEQTALNEVSTNDTEAHDLYLRGEALRSGGEDRLYVEGALRLYQAAVERDPRFAEALAELAKMHLFIYWMHYDRSRQRVVSAKDAAERAVELRPDLAETHAALGYYFYWGLSEYPRALSEFATALKIQPNSTDALLGSKALDLDPKNAQLLYNFGFSCVLARRYADADRAWTLAMAVSPQWGTPYGERAWLQVKWHGDLEKAQEVLDEAGRVAGLTDDAGDVAEGGLRVLTARRDYQTALRQLAAETRRILDNQTGYQPIPLLRGVVLMLAGRHDLARQSFEAARLELDQKVAKDPDDPRSHSALGVADAGLGRRVEAVREAKAGCDLAPASKDAIEALYRLEDRALVYTMVGRPGEAIAQLDDLLARSGWFTANVLRLDPRWDPLRPDPRFQALIAKHEVTP
jgi:TolB-like protein/tetratricopeptide (TPR) repeat protein